MSKPSASGVFTERTDPRVEKFTESVSFDARLLRHDVAGSQAHARMLSAVGLLTSDEAESIARTLDQIAGEIESGELPLRQDFEDIHMNVEHALTERLGDAGRKLHTARSRNDQINTDFRLWIRSAIDRLDELLLDLQKAFVSRCDRDRDVILPAYTHLQRAQPVLAPHYWLAYCEKFERDRARLADCRRRVNVSGLGSAALAGTSLPIDREMTAQALRFEGVAANSLDVSSDRDFVLEFVFCLSTVAIHLSGLAEEWILWTTTEFGFIKLPQTFCTGSSIMPQKINPDVLELIRGKTARTIGALQTLAVLTKGLPLAYNRDLQEDKPPAFDAYDTVASCLELAAPLVAGAELRRESIARRLHEGYLDATTLMEALMLRGMPQRRAHELVGTIVRRALDRGVPLADLPLEEFQQIDSTLDASIYDVLGVENAIRAFKSYGSTAPSEVDRQIARWQARVGS
ncbi:MAG TPA: argininosuccinate lyase [Pirellulaceae bacterium]|nr:argininosuccinate lyase [Pirellulaceae bacterium]